MKELPILFSTPMVQSITEDIKTMTRRIRGLKRVNEAPDDWKICIGDFTDKGILFFNKNGFSDRMKPQYSVGDHIWVRETFREFEYGKFEYKAQFTYPELHKWKSSLFLPKIAARIWLECTNVRCERLWDISEADALAEGFKRWTEPDIDWFRYKDYTGSINWYLNAKGSFMSLWRQINGDRSVIINPWVFIYEFKRITK